MPTFLVGLFIGSIMNKNSNSSRRGGSGGTRKIIQPPVPKKVEVRNK